MSGHSKWSSIKHKKGAADAKRGKLFSKLARAITVAARDGGGDIEGNPSLGTAVQKAREASMPKDKIQKAIDTGTGAGVDAANYEHVIYEGYGPAGVAVLVEALTDNRNRASAEIRHAFSTHGGGLGEPGSVAWNFEKKGVVVLDADRYSALEAAGIAIDSAALATEPKSTVELTGKDAERMIDLLDVLDDQDDVDQVYANFDIPESVLEQLAA
jgi:YebC/PmpR family DNA-binding regulatory protein